MHTSSGRILRSHSPRYCMLPSSGYTLNNMGRELTLRIIPEQPPQGRGSAYETVQKQRSVGNDLKFVFTVGLKVGDRENAPDLSGPFVQGPPGQRFVHIDIGTYAGQTDV